MMQRNLAALIIILFSFINVPNNTWPKQRNARSQSKTYAVVDGSKIWHVFTLGALF